MTWQWSIELPVKMESHVCMAGVHIFDSNDTVAVDKLMLQDGRWERVPPSLIFKRWQYKYHSCQLIHFSSVITRFFACLHTLFSSHAGYTLSKTLHAITHIFVKINFWCFPSLCFCRPSFMPRSRFANGFFWTCEVSLWVVFTIPLTKSFWENFQW
jgi:hypothetical protein